MGGRADQLNPTHLFAVHPDSALWTAAAGLAHAVFVPFAAVRENDGDGTRRQREDPRARVDTGTATDAA